MIQVLKWLDKDSKEYTIKMSFIVVIYTNGQKWKHRQFQTPSVKNRRYKEPNGNFGTKKKIIK